MKVITPGKVSISHVMWQVLDGCTRNCQGCFAKYAPKSEWDWNKALPEFLANTDKYDIGQVTLSLDCIDLDETLEATPLVQNLREFWKEKHPYHLCITCRDWDKLCDWSDLILNRGITDFIKPLYMISLSQWDKNPRWEAWNREVELNYNCVVYPGQVSLAIKQVERALSEGVDQVYLILFKPPLGYPLNQRGLYSWMEVYTKLSEEYSKEVIPDQCIVDSINCLEKGYTCSAGIGKAHVWADGGATGCPYDSTRLMGDSTLLGLEENTRANYPIDECSIHVWLSWVKHYHPERYFPMFYKIEPRLNVE